MTDNPAGDYERECTLIDANDEARGLPPILGAEEAISELGRLAEAARKGKE